MNNEIRTGMLRRCVQENVRDWYTDGTGVCLPYCSNCDTHEAAK
jgi:hypothetical protein